LNSKISQIFSREVWKAILKRDISTFNIPENISLKLYNNVYRNYNKHIQIFPSEITYLIDNLYDKRLEAIITLNDSNNIDTILFDLSRSNNIVFIENIMKKVNISTIKQCNRILDGASFYDHIEVIKWLSELCKDLDYNSGLWYAIRGGRKEIINLLIDMGANDYNEALAEACSIGDMS